MHYSAKHMFNDADFIEIEYAPIVQKMWTANKILSVKFFLFRNILTTIETFTPPFLRQQV